MISIKTLQIRLSNYTVTPNCYIITFFLKTTLYNIRLYNLIYLII